MQPMFSPEDLSIETIPELFRFMPILIFCGLCGPFLITVYTIGFVSDLIGWLD